MSQAEFIKRWCLNNVLAEVSSDADGSAVVRVHVPPLNAVTVPMALWSSSVLSGPLLACSACCLWLRLLRLPWAAVQCLCSFAFRALVSSCSAVCPLCWLPRRLVYVCQACKDPTLKNKIWYQLPARLSKQFWQSAPFPHPGQGLVLQPLRLISGVSGTVTAGHQAAVEEVTVVFMWWRRPPRPAMPWAACCTIANWTQSFVGLCCWQS
jgi:hypothetical protein